MTGYDRWPVIDVPGEVTTWRGADLWAELDRAARERDDKAPLIVVDAYPGVALADLVDAASAALPGYEVVDVEDAAARPIGEIDALIGRNLTEDRIFGVLSHHRLVEFYDAGRLAALAGRVAAAEVPQVLVGLGAALAADVQRALIVLADLPRWELQQRQRRGAPNWRCHNEGEDALRKVKRGYFVEWRVADRHKRTLFDRVDYLLDTTRSVSAAVLITGATFRAGLSEATRRPFRLVPFFDPGPWGGTWMQELAGLEPTSDPYAWCFDCVPEENSLLLGVGEETVEIPAMDLVLTRPRELLGERTFARFGAEFPIRFDFLDTMDGGNLSLQVHPLTDYIRDAFGMAYTQDESYYLLDAAPGAEVYLGLRDETDVDQMFAELVAAQAGGPEFPAERYVNTFPAAKHDHFLIPAGTVHCSGANSMVLEISATPYLFTFKMWDWGRLGLDGIPRPVHLDHARANVASERRSEWVKANLVDRVERLGAGPGWVEERTGLHELEFIEVRRHWFSEAVEHDTAGTVNVVNLVEGPAAVVESPTGAFAPMEIHYAETFVVPAAVGAYRIRPLGQDGTRHGTVKAYVRGTQRPG